MIILANSLHFRLQATMLLLAIASLSALAADDVPLDGDAYLFAGQAYQELAAGRLDAAAAEVSNALRLRPDSRQLGLLLLDIQVRKGILDDAIQQADALLALFPDDLQVLVQRGYIAQRQERHQAAMEDFYAALSQFGLDTKQQRDVRMAWADSALVTKQYQVVLDALAPFAAEHNAAVQLRRAYAYVGLDDREQAHAAAKMAEAGSDSDRQLVAVRQLLEQTAPVAPSDLDLAYKALRDKNDHAALEAFQRSFSAKPGTAAQYSDAAYTAKRLGDNELAIVLFSKALDVDAQLSSAEYSFDEQHEFGYRREIQEMSRKFGVVASNHHQSSGFGTQNNINILQGGMEAYWQPEGIGYQSGRIFQVFARGYETLYDKSGGVTGSATVQGSVGARYKPIGDMDMVLTAEKLFPVGSLASNDWLMRAGFSTGDGIDIRPYNHDWNTWQFYTEGAYFVNAGRYIQSIESRHGHSWRVGGVGRMVVIPHVVMAGDFDSRAIVRTALGAGPGVSLRYWFREDKYQAPASWFELTSQYRFEFTNTRRAGGMSLRATLWY